MNIANTPNVANTLAVLMGSVRVSIGLSIFNKSYFTAVMADLTNSKGLLWLTGFVTFVMGMVMVALYNVWSADWRVLVTVLGWLTVIKGAVILLVPSSMILLYRRFWSNHLLNYSGIYALALGGRTPVPGPCAVALHERQRGRCQAAPPALKLRVNEAEWNAGCSPPPLFDFTAFNCSPESRS